MVMLAHAFIHWESLIWMKASLLNYPHFISVCKWLFDNSHTSPFLIGSTVEGKFSVLLYPYFEMFRVRDGPPP